MNKTLLEEKRRLQTIIDQNMDDAESGSISARMCVVSAQSDLDRIAQSEIRELLAISALPLEMEALSF
jgi:hypothetical protein